MPRRLMALWPLVAYAGLAVAMTWPLALHAATALSSAGDPQQQAWILAWDAHALRADPLRVWQAPIFYPYPDTLAYHDHMLLLALPVAPLLWAGAPPPLALNLLVLASYALTAWSVYHLALECMRAAPRAGLVERAAAFVGGAAFSFSAYRMAHIVHLNLLQIFWLPWALMFLVRTLRHGRWRDALLLGAMAGLQVANSLYYAFFALAVLGGYAALWAARAVWRRVRAGAPLPWPALGRLAGGGALAAAIGMPFLLPYLRLYQSLGIVRSPREIDNWSAPLQAYLASPDFNRLYGSLGPLFHASGGEFALFPGATVALLALAGLAAGLRGARRLEAMFLALLCAASFVLSLGSAVRLVRGGPALPIALPYPLLYGSVPGFAAMRVPARWGMLVALGLAVLAACGLAALARAAPRRLSAAILLAALALVLAEQLALPTPLTPPGLLDPQPVAAWLGQPAQRDVGVVLELPLGRTPRGAELQRIMDRHYQSWLHWKQLPVAYGALIPFGTTDILGRVQGLPRQEALRFLQLLGVDTLVIHQQEYGADQLAELVAGLDQSPLVRKRAALGDALVYTVLPAPEAQPPLPAGASVYVSGDERAPGVLALALVQRWQAAGVKVYGPGRTRYYAPLGQLAPGQVADAGLLAQDEDPRAYGFDPARLRWSTAGLALYDRDPALRASLALGAPPAGQFHPRYPGALDIQVDAGSARIGEQVMRWPAGLREATIELDVASLQPQTLRAGGVALDVPAGASSAALAVPLGQAVRVSADGGAVVLRVRVRSGGAAPAGRAYAAAVASQGSFDGERLTLQVAAGGPGDILLEAQGAAASDDHPVHLFRGALPRSDGAQAVSVALNVLQPEAPWIDQQAPAEDGRYIAYLRDAARPGAPGLPVAQWSVRAGRVVDARVVPLPLTELR